METKTAQTLITEEAFDFLLGTPLTLEYNGDIEHDIPQYHGASK